MTSGRAVENSSLDVELHTLLSEQSASPSESHPENQLARKLESQPESQPASQLASQKASQPESQPESQPTRQTIVPTQRIVASQNITSLGGLQSVVSRVVSQEENTLPELTELLHDESSANALVEKELF